jgi:hypothetical protein
MPFFELKNSQIYLENILDLEKKGGVFNQLCQR